jgi:hypothetical protein
MRVFHTHGTAVANALREAHLAIDSMVVHAAAHRTG